MKNLNFRELNNEGKKTKRWEVSAVTNTYALGVISFWPAWRKYVFKPSPDTLYDHSCLSEIADFCEAESTKWRAAL